MRAVFGPLALGLCAAFGGSAGVAADAVKRLDGPAKTNAVTPDPNAAAVYGDWSYFEETDPDECWIATTPLRWEATRDGVAVEIDPDEVMLFVAPSTDPRSPYETSFTMARTLAPVPPPELTVADRAYALLTNDDWAWLTSLRREAALAEALRGAREAQVSAHDSEGMHLVAVFSARGYGAALDALMQDCPYAAR